MRRGTIKKFGRERGTRAALLRSLATALIEHGRIVTTKTRAKTLSAYIEKFITRARKNDLASRRLISVTFDPKTVKKLIGEIAPRFTDRKGGYTRVISMERRVSDSSPMALVEFIS